MQTNPPQEQIKTSSLSVTYFPGQTNEVKSLDNINISIYEGEFIIFFGPSGCGKSTLLYSIADLEKFQGDIVVEGRKINELIKGDKVNYYRDSIGMVFQAYHLIPTLSVVQNVELPLISAGIKPKERRERAMDLLVRFGVNNQANKLPNELSGGQQQRVAICRAVINNPKILLADEPLGNLDSKSANEVIGLFKDINIKLGKTVILVTHDPTYLDIAHRVFFIKDGKLIDTKVNRDIKDKLINKDGFATSAHTKELDFLSNHYSKVKTTEPDFLIRTFQARNMATLALTGFSSDDFDLFRGKVENSLKIGDDFKQVMEFLDLNNNQGGLGLDRRTAEKITDHLRVLRDELKATDDLPQVDGEHARTEEVKKEEEREDIILRKAIFDELDIDLKHYESLAIIDNAILSRIRGEIDRGELYRQLNQPLKKGGAGLDKRLVNKMVKRLEIWLIGHKE
jgi:putative ABC transport system ATP-binding protein